VTVLNLPASFWRQWLSELNVAAGRPPSSVRLLIVGNERVGTDDWEQWVSLAGPSVETRNAYGPTETTITATVFGPSASLPAGTGSVPIGRAIANVQTFILDAMLRPVSIGLPGELYIAGDGLARGYLGRSAETASSFVPHPFVPGARIYRSGDICRYLPDGNLEFLGRFDNQVKIRGYRVELEEVERALGEHPRIRECAAAMHEHDGQTRLAAYVVPRSEPELWPSIGEYFLHDPLMYHAMTHDESRNQAYRTAISRCVKDKVVLDIGTGADAILARFCLEFGARRVYAIEKLESAYVQAERLLAELGIDDRIVLLKGEATDIQLPEKADVCVSELLGMIGSAEGVIGILNDARRFLKDDGVMIPVRCVTKMAAAFLPGELAAQPRFTELSGPYAEKVFDSIGHPFDVRVCIRNFPDDHLVSDAQVFEHLDFNGVVSPMLRSEVLLTITRRARVDGFLLWLNVYTADDVMLDVRREEHNWLPVFFPAFYPGIEVEPGDVIRAVCSVDSNGQTLPGYRITGSIVRSNGSIIPFDYESLHDSDFFRRSPFYQKLFTEDWQENYRPIPQFIPEIRSLLRDRVPEYLIPSSFVTLKTLPRLPNGKVDRRSLPRPNDVGSGPAHSFQLPRNHIEKQLAALWAETLGVDRVGVHDNFFELGGDSIVSIQLVSRARREGIGITVNQLFQHPTVAELARVANVADGTVAGVEAESAQTVISRDVPLTAIQQWFFEQDFVNPDHSNQAVMFEVRQPLNLAIASDAVRVLVSRHDALRLRFAATKEGWRQFYATAETAPGIHLIDLSTVEEHDQKNAIEAEAVRIQASLNLDAGPIFRAAYLDFGRAGSGRLLFVVHHLAVDTVSWRILMEDFWTAYAQLAGQTAVQSASRTASFQTWAERIKDYALRSHALRQELKFWIQLANSPTTPVPVDLPGGANTIESAQTVRVALNPEETAALLLNVPRAYQTHINDVLLTALTQACCRWTGKTQVFLYLEGHGREDILEGLDVSRTVGWFTSLFPVRLDLANIRQPGEALKSIKEQLRRIPNRGIGYGLLRYLSGDARIKEQLSAMPSPEITFNYLGQMGDRDSENVPVVRAMEDVGPLVSMADRRAGLLDINGIVSEGKLQFSWTYSKNIHHHSTIEKVAQDFIRMLQALIEHCLSPQAGGYTPSDFSRARVSQKDLDGLLRDLGSGPGNAS
jgi:non-ribosomal peptide synthase protein (TIGR01720 family)